MGFLSQLIPLLAIINNIMAKSHMPDSIKLVVGQPFQYEFSSSLRNLEVKDASGEELPSWLIWDSSLKQLEGVPQYSDIGKSYLRITDGTELNTVLEISVSEETKNPCGTERTTLWMEIIFDVAINELSIAKQMRIVKIVTEYFDVNSALLRLYPEKYKDEIRHSEVVESGMQNATSADRLTVMWKVSCEEVDEGAIEVLEKVLSLDESEIVTEQKLIGWKLTKGKILLRKQRNEMGNSRVVSEFSGFATNEPLEPIGTTISSRTTAQRISRSTKKSDNPPVRLNSLPTFRCKRGSLCEFAIPKGIFMDAEDGDTHSLSLSVHPIREKKWLTIDKSSHILRGIPLDQGDFEYRLEARDSSNQMASAPFRVTVEESAPTNHIFVLEIQKSYERLSEPETLYAFTEKLANSLGDRYPKHIVIRSLKSMNNGRTLVSFSNDTLSHKFCQRKAIDNIKYLMLTKKRDRIRNDFVRAMDSRFHVRSAQLELLGLCGEKVVPIPTESDDFDATTMATDISTAPSYLWLPVALLAFLITFLAVLITVCCVLKRKKMKTVQSEYVSKGLPVVFPEELPQEDEAATVSTPMLVKEERPPLIISQHENPLYKPPPPISTASSPRPRNSATNQRQPPPYVPP